MDFPVEDCVVCDFCKKPMIPNLSTGDEDGYAWSCLTIGCKDYHGDELEAEDLEACGCPSWLTSLLVAPFDRIAELETEVARRDRMLRLAWFDFTSGDEPIMPNTIDDWLADLKARAEEGSE